ncbi:PREDICTED: uncharacterized protein LOC101292444 [Fragaria vesca subsp. vesca]|uniref:uncharacterized protein LOC101292444 n=1 Tax=Fragaria vesca subsp. vesca TaxID=101020 RepID=UPI0002C2DD90|nr:PREDICTED: uncharacterized protein LOC101292444 [Fragaria vesca subsp. vesca]XP_011467871.1 PREDICTED: uncharacterized protein LOC101292444 [Fragaria vesca subsp. vesca]
MAVAHPFRVPKKPCTIDIISDPVSPWCFIAKKNLDLALQEADHLYEFELRWHPFQTDPDIPKEGIDKKKHSEEKHGLAQISETVEMRIGDIFRMSYDGIEYKLSGIMGNPLDYHRLIYFAGEQDHDMQHDLVDEILLGYFTEEKDIADREYLVECAGKIGIEGAAEFLEDPNNGLKEVTEELEKYSGTKQIPYYVFNGKVNCVGAQPMEVFLRAFEAATK